jgi:hypothetical protein
LNHTFRQTCASYVGCATERPQPSSYFDLFQADYKVDSEAPPYLRLDDRRGKNAASRM